MTLGIRKGPLFADDLTAQFSWYLDEANENVAWRFKEAIDTTLLKLADHPHLGRERHFENPQLHGLRSIRIEPPFEEILLFYRIADGVPEAWRLMHGKRDLPQRLPGSGP